MGITIPLETKKLVLRMFRQGHRSKKIAILFFENAFSFFFYCADMDKKFGLPISKQAFSELVELLEFTEFEKIGVCKSTKINSILFSAIRGAIEENDRDFLFYVKNTMLNIFKYFTSG